MARFDFNTALYYVCVGNAVTPESFSRFKKYLKSIYQRVLATKDDKLSISPCSEFINLSLVQKPSDTKRSSKTPIGIDDILSSNAYFVLVEGPPGIGKSTLCWELCRQWDAFKSLQDFKIVLQLKLREKRVQEASSLCDIFITVTKSCRRLLWMS